jgi:hypothetical protein
LSTRPNPETYNLNSAGPYFEAKSANVLTATELSKSKGALNAYSLHRGGEFNSCGLCAQK